MSVGHPSGAPTRSPVAAATIAALHGGGGNGGGGAGLPSTILDFDFHTGPTAYGPSPTIQWAFDAQLNRLFYSTTGPQRDHTTATGKEYMEWKVAVVPATAESYSFYFGFNNAGQSARQDSPHLIGIEKETPTGSYRACHGGSSYDWETINTGIDAGYKLAVGDVLGIAIDWDAGKVYMHLNNTWVTTTAGALGGEPGVGNGYTISGTTQTKRVAMGLRVFSTDAGEQLQGSASNPEFLPAGYTAIS